MSGDKKNLQNLKALKRAPQGTLAFRFYLLIISSVSHVYKDFCNTVNEKLERVKKGNDERVADWEEESHMKTGVKYANHPRKIT